MGSEMTEVSTATPNLPAKRTKTLPRYPKYERPEYQKMYAYYQGLGPGRSLRRVAQEFHKAACTVSLISRAFEWQLRLKQNLDLINDPFSMLAKPGVEKARQDVVNLLCEVTTIFAEMTDLAKIIRLSGVGELREDQKLRKKSLINALDVFGVQIRTPKDFRDIVATLKDVMDFNKKQDVDAVTHKGNTENKVLINEMNLTIKDD